MLIELRIENLAVIERLTVSLQPGLNVLSGETGAGKSIIVGALSLLLGERASTEAVRAGADRAVVEGVFDVSARPDIRSLLEEQGNPPEDGLLILRREVASEGRNRAWVNGAASTAGALGQLGARLVDLHGQHEHQTLLRVEAQRDILDAYAGQEALAARVRAAHADLLAARAALQALHDRGREIEQRADFLRFQLREIEDAGLEPGEDERLADEGRRLEHSEDLVRLAGALNNELYEGEDAVAGTLGGLRRHLEELIRIDPTQADCRELLDSAYFSVEELGRRMGDYASSIDHDPARLDAVRKRQDLLYRLMAKYGPTLDDVLETARRARSEIDTLDGVAFEKQAAEQQVRAAHEAVGSLSASLSAARLEAAGTLTEDVMKILPALGLEGARFQVEFEPLPEPGPHGAERVEFLIAVNRGFEPRPLARVASGGELSRIMLALKTILARVDAVPTLVFDEIDAGIGGRIGARVGAQLRDVARHHQVFAITHLAQIASRAHHHLLVLKDEENGLTRASIQQLDDQARVHEVARMLGGDPESKTSLDHARELLAAP